MRINKIFKISEKFYEKGVKPKVSLMGLTFKPDIDDLRESPALRIANAVYDRNDFTELFIVEPNIAEHHVCFDQSLYCCKMLI